MRSGVTVMLGALLLAGCPNRGGSADCYEVCEAANACELKERPVDVECDHFCPDGEDMQGRMQKAADESKWTPAGDSATCAEEFNAHLSCWKNAKGNICRDTYFNYLDPKKNPPTELPDGGEEIPVLGCSDTANAWVECMAPYCEYAGTEVELEDGGTTAGPAGTAAEPNCYGDGTPALFPF